MQDASSSDAPQAPPAGNPPAGMTRQAAASQCGPQGGAPPKAGPPRCGPAPAAFESREYIEALFHRYLKDPSQMDPSWRRFFEGVQFASQKNLAAATGRAPESRSALSSRKETAVFRLLSSYRDHGALKAALNPIGGPVAEDAFPSLKSFQIEKGDLNKKFAVTESLLGQSMTLGQAIAFLEKTYCGPLSLRAGGSSPEEREWLFRRFEEPQAAFSPEEKKEVFVSLSQAEGLERFLHFRFMGKKRFSLEGLDALIPLMERLLKEAAGAGVKEAALGMAHRGRINMLVHFMQRDLRLIFSQFDDRLTGDGAGKSLQTADQGKAAPFKTEAETEPKTEEDVTGDVKYHLGFSSERQTENGPVRLYMGFNPSHLEAINPVVAGIARALQRRRGDTEHRKSVLPVLIHGDASFCGQGSVSETLQLSRLKGWTVGGTLHIILNNQLGFTTDPYDGRSALFPSDAAQSVQAPALLVNADSPEAGLRAASFALQFRQKFGRDIFIELTGYRRHGHNEGDEPSFTQPVLYKKIKTRPSVREIYEKALIEEKALSKEEAETIRKNYEKHLEDRLREARSAPPPPFSAYLTGGAAKKADSAKGGERAAGEEANPLKTAAASQKTVEEVLNLLCKEPPDFHLHPKIKKLLEKRKRLIQEKRLDWGLCELAAYGTLLKDGCSVRLTGQDSKRGTFSHRHAVYFDYETGKEFSPLKEFIANRIEIKSPPGRKRECCIYNSPLSEAAVLGFEYGNSCMAGDFLTVWEAQFGDFINSAQVIVDQFIASGESKWLQRTDIVLLLPHGYEGQGPEHSSAGLERFLQLCAGQNMRVCNLTSPANLFHALRGQKTGRRVPLIIMTPKSLLRHPEAVAAPEELFEGEFQEILGDRPAPLEEEVTHVALCSGKVYYDLKNHPERLADKDKRNRLAIFRLERLFPFPKAALNAVLNGFPRLEKALWLQEEPQNRGAWTFMEPRLRSLLREIGRGDLPVEYTGRAAAAAPAEGSLAAHKKEQDRIIRRLLSEVS